MKTSKKNLFRGAIAIVLCAAMLVGGTLAWFTDSVSSNDNIVKSGKLDIDLLWTMDLQNGPWIDTAKTENDPIFTNNLWEPGYTEVRYFKIQNKGNLAFQYALQIVPNGEVGVLADVIDVYYVENPTANIAGRRDLTNMTPAGTLSAVIDGTASAQGVLLPAGEYESGFHTGEIILAVALKMQESAGNEYQGKTIGDSFNVMLHATQYTYEEDAFGPDYDAEAPFPFPDNTFNETVTVNVEVDSNGQVANAVTLSSDGVSITVPVGVKVADGVSALTLTVTEKEGADGNVTLKENEELRALDVHVDGVATDNAVPLTVELEGAAPTGLNEGNLALYHVENGTTNAMEKVAASDAFDEHNQFKYDPATGDVVLYMASFSEVGVVADTVNPWNGNYDYSWYTNAVALADGEAATEYIIANGDQLAGFGAIVGGMNGQTQDSFTGKTVKLISDVNLGDDEENNNESLIFYPIGYNSSDGKYEKTEVAVTTGFYAFQGTFDGQGHTISNFYQNTWEMKGDHNWYDATLQYYRDGMGLFGKVYGGTVKNLTVSNFSSDGEITTTGTIAAYADCGATFENISIFNCNPRVYNIGNGGIVGCVGWYAEETTNDKVTFRNITVDNSNKISALWGSYDVACGGLVGQYYPTSGQSVENAGIHMENCHVAAQMDVYNDVCGNYQYYAYRYAGMMIGSIRENLPADANGHIYPNMDGITATGCTVHFGDWNDYYYCELVDNSLASYTHDHQMSRLEQVDSVDVANKTVTVGGKTTDIPNSGRYNYVVVNGDHATENATCYHFVDGKQHFHNDYNGDGTDDYETVDGKSVLVEDKQHIYLEFNQLFTGYGWGVTSKGLTDFEGITNMDITAGDQDESVQKFEVILSAETQLEANTAISIDTLFKAIEGAEINSSAVQAAVTALDDNGITATYNADTSDWTKGTLTFDKIEGMAKVTIQDYNFCEPTSFILKDGKLYEIEKFAIVFPNVDKYLYRVGNLNTVSLSSLFSVKNDATINSADVCVTIDKVDERSNASAAFSADAVDWTNGTIQFSGTGPVKVTIQDDENCKPTELYLEIVDGYNVTSYGELQRNANSVLLNNITMSSGGAILLQKCTLYGNGFEFDISLGRNDANTNTKFSIIGLDNSNLDNVQVIGEVYTSYGATANSAWSSVAVGVSGNCTISNSLIANTLAPVKVMGNATIKNTVLSGGRYANLDISSGSAVLENVTTINTSNGGALGVETLGLGIVFHVNAVSSTLSINGLTQHNWIEKTADNQYFSGDAQLNSMYNQMFTANAGLLHTTSDGKTYVNTGILALNESVTDSSVNGEPAGYQWFAVSSIMGDGNVATYSNTEYTFSTSDIGTVTYVDSVLLPGTYISNKQNPTVPDYTWSYPDTYVSSEGIIKLSVEQGKTITLDPNILSVNKNGQTLPVTVTMNGTDYSGQTITFNDTQAGNYSLVYSANDPYSYSATGQTDNTTTTWMWSLGVNVSVTKPDIAAPDFTFETKAGTTYSGKAGKSDGEVNNGIRTEIINGQTYIMPDVSSADFTFGSSGQSWAENSVPNIGALTVNGETVYMPIVTGYTDSGVNKYYPFYENITIVDYSESGSVTYNSSNPTSSGSVTEKHVFYAESASLSEQGLTVPSGYLGSQSIGVGSKTGPDFSIDTSSGKTQPTPVFSKDYGGWGIKSNSISSSGTNNANLIYYARFSFTAGNGETYYYYVGYAFPKYDPGCFTPDTLITLADGTQKRIDEVNFGDKILAWDFFTGQYVEKDISLLVNHGENLYRVANLRFSDGTMLRLIGEHGVFDYDLNKYVYITADNVKDYIGHRFVQQNLDGGYNIVMLKTGFVTQEYTSAWSITSADTSNAFASGLLTVAPPDDFYNWIEMGGKLRYDAEKFAADVEKYGLYTYDVFADYVTYEQFVAFNGAYLKIPVEKGLFKFEYILELIELYKGWMPQ